MVSFKSTQKLDKASVKYSLFKLDKQAYTVEDVVKYSRGMIKSDEICKTMILTDDQGLGFGVLLLGVSRVDLYKVGEITEKKLHLASRKEVIELTGIEPGAICPIILDIPLLVEKQVLLKNRINFGSGDHLYGIEMNSLDLKKVVEYRIIM